MNGYVAAGYLVAAGVIVLYAWRTLRRGRLLARWLRDRPDQETPWG